eukprot:814941-Karenia_brevis.AAC.1
MAGLRKAFVAPLFRALKPQSTFLATLGYCCSSDTWRKMCFKARGSVGGLAPCLLRHKHWLGHYVRYGCRIRTVSYTHLRAHETLSDL